ncbi:MAG: glycosyl transferase, partial [Actinobacteria bacterium]|nr:glycosyl transferase [Actinomycetota bacterium]
MTIGWYVHHHGAGHLHRFLAVREHLGADVVGMGSMPRPAAVPPEGWIALPGDVPEGEPDDPTAGGALHWVPRGVPGLRDRTAAIAAWVAAARPSAFVVDVSVEVALLARLLSVPTVLVAQRGRRTDRPHRLAHDAASAVLAPWTSASHAPGDGPPEDRLVLCGAVSRFDGLPAPSPRVPAREPGRVLLLVGAGGHALRAPDVAAAAAATPGVRWDVAGALRVPDAPGVRDHGPRADVRALLHEADVVVGTAGGNVVAEVAAARRPLVLLPQDRPFAEQHRQAELLGAAGLATALPAWPAADAWPALLREAAERGTDGWAVHHDGRGAHRMAAAVRAVAE